MKMSVKVSEVEGEGLLAFLDQSITIYCSAYIYTGKLIGVNGTCVKLTGAKIVYDTGAFNTKDWATAEAFPKDWYVQLSAIESFGALK